MLYFLEKARGKDNITTGLGLYDLNVDFLPVLLIHCIWTFIDIKFVHFLLYCVCILQGIIVYWWYY